MNSLSNENGLIPQFSTIITFSEDVILGCQECLCKSFYSGGYIRKYGDGGGGRLVFESVCRCVCVSVWCGFILLTVSVYRA